MTWAPQEIQKVLFTTLNGDAALTTLLGGNKVFDRVPDELPFPFITIGDIIIDDRGNHTWEGLSATITINSWYREANAGRKKVQEIQNRIDQLIHKQDPCIEGWNVVSLRRGPANILIEDDNITIHGVQKFNLLIGEA